MPVFVVGLWLVAWTLLSAIRTVVLPRGAHSAITRAVFVTVGVPFRWAANERRTFSDRDRVMALYAPVSLMMLPGIWLVMVTAGYTLMFWALGGRSFTEAFHFSGSSITTLGFVPADTFADHAFAFTEAAMGLLLVALLITYLPALYSSFSKREALVALLEVRAGKPPSATEFLQRHHAIGWLQTMRETWFAWELWFAEIEESHSSFPALVFFRSPDPGRSWITAAGTVLDSASLTLACVRDVEQGPPGVCIRSGYLSLRTIAEFFGVDHDPDPGPSDPISITRAEFDETWAVFERAGIPLKSDQDQAWLDFSGWRVNYDSVLLNLAEVTMAPVAPWVSDRSAPGYRRPRVRFFFGRKVAAEDG